MESAAGRDSAIAGWIWNQRWFGEKSRQLESFSLASFGVVDCGAIPVDLLTIECEFRDGERSSYFIPLVSAPASAADNDPSSIEDAFGRSEFLDWFAGGFRGRVLVQGERKLSWIPGGSPGAHARDYGAARLVRSEQSNTSIQYGDHAIAKVFRRLRPGVNPDVELIQYLTEQTAYRHVPAHEGAVIMHKGRRDSDVTLAAMQHYVPNAGDCWTWLLHELETGTRAEEKDLVSAIALLGRRTAELHRALASPSADPAFAPEQIGKRESDAFVARLTAELDQTMSAVASAGVRSEANLDATRQSIAQKISQAPILEGSLATRVHGDYHLGQVLRTTDDFVIIDFEGEPSRPIELRREKASPLKDVAGMVRSLDYAVATLERAGVASGTATFRDWGAHASAAFIAAYRASIETGGRMILPQSAATFAATLDLYLIEKALYEVRYELDNRPDWLEIPLSALEALGKEPTTAPSGN